MRVSLEWLNEFVCLSVSPEELADKLTMAGLEVESITRIGGEVSRVITGCIKEIVPHPNADRLIICQIDFGQELLNIVTGAPNVQVGNIIPVALEEARLANGEVIKKARFRGVESRGMLCSGQELGLDSKTLPADQAHGIMILPQGTPLGEEIGPLIGLGDIVLELELTPNRGDCLSVIGVAREAAAIFGLQFNMLKPSFPELNEQIEDQAKVKIEEKELCCRYVARMVKNVTVGPSPLWMQRRLRAAGVRPINNIVDITNYVMMELGQPLHAFDFSTLHEGQIIVRRARGKEVLVSLDGVERQLTEEMLVIADSNKPVAIAGVMGGLDTEVTAQTKTILLESACFNPVKIRRTSWSLGLRSESSLRFEKGVDIGGCVQAVNRAAELIYLTGAGEILSGVIDNYSLPVKEHIIALRPERVNFVAGVDIPKSEIVRTLSALQFIVQEADTSFLVTVPTFRPDIQREIDLIEEIVRLYGYNKLPTTLPGGNAAYEVEARGKDILGATQKILTGCGLNQVITLSFCSRRIFDYLKLPMNNPLRQAVCLANPLSEELSILRPVLLPNLLEVALRNQNRQVQGVAIFEIGKVFRLIAGQEQPLELPSLSAVIMGNTAGSWNQKARPFDFYYLKGILEILFERLGLKMVEFYPEVDNPSFHPGCTASIKTGDASIGILGELHPDILENYGFSERVIACELNLEAILAAGSMTRTYSPLPRFPGVERDIAVLIPQGTSAEKVFKVIHQAGGKLLLSVGLFDVYKGSQVPEGKQSMAFSLKFQILDRTLTDEEVEDSISAITAALVEKLGAELRG